MKTTVTISGLEDAEAVLGAIAPREAINLLRVTTFDMAKQGAAIAKTFTPDDPTTAPPDLRSSIKARREKGSKTRVRASVVVGGKRTKQNVGIWWLLEYGTIRIRPFSMFLKTFQAMKPQLVPVFLKSFGLALERRLARARKR